MRAAGATEPGEENLERLRSRLRRNPAALAALRRLGISGGTADRYHLGLREAYTSRVTGAITADALTFPVLGSLGRPLGKYANLALEGVTANPPHPVGWCAGRPLSYWGLAPASGADVLVSGRIANLWRLGELPIASAKPLAMLAPSQPDGIPSDWRDPRFWSGFGRVIFIDQPGECDAFVAAVARSCSRPMARLAAPEPAEGARSLAADRLSQTNFDDLVAAAAPWFPDVPVPIATVAAEDLGDFQAEPVSIVGAYVGKHLYYPFGIEERSLIPGAADGEAYVVQAYRTRVLRSDGALLSVDRLPSPPGTPSHSKVLALSDGTRVADGLDVSRLASWRHASIRDFIAWRRGDADRPFRDLPMILADVRAHIDSRVWLNDADDRIAVALYVLLSHFHQVFDAIPLLIVAGPAATGKSELVHTVAELGFNGMVVGHVTGAALVRLVEETRGLVAIDDAAALCGPARPGALAQILITGCRRTSARKLVADRGGRVRTINYFGPRVVTAELELDTVLASRSVIVRSQVATDGFAGWATSPAISVADLRDELHCWAMATAGEVADAYGGILAAGADRRAETIAPFRAIARILGCGKVTAAVGHLANRR